MSSLTEFEMCCEDITNEHGAKVLIKYLEIKEYSIPEVLQF